MTSFYNTVRPVPPGSACSAPKQSKTRNSHFDELRNTHPDFDFATRRRSSSECETKSPAEIAVMQRVRPTSALPVRKAAMKRVKYGHERARSAVRRRIDVPRVGSVLHRVSVDRCVGRAFDHAAL